MDRIFYTGVILLLDRLAVFYFSSGSSRLLCCKSSAVSFILLMVVFNGISHVVLWTISVLYGGILSEEFGTCPIKHTVICCPFYVAACLSMTRFVSDL